MSFADELEVNQFYNHALSKQSYLQQVLTNGSVLCIPAADSLPQSAATDRFLDLHILKPSPLFKGEYSTVWYNSSGEHKTIKLDDQGRSLVATYAGGSNVIDVLYTEAAYIKGAKYFVWLIQRPLNKLKIQNGPVVQRSSRLSTPALKLNIETLSFSDVKTFLEQAGVQYLHMVEKEIQHFKSKYIVLHTFLHDASIKLEAIANKCSYNGMLPEGYNMQTHAALLSYIHHRTFTYIYPHVKECCAAIDRKYEQQQSVIQRSRVATNQIACSMVNNWLSELNQATCPLQLISILKLSLDEMCTSAVGPATKKGPLSSDELIPLVIDTLLSRKDISFPSLLQYIEIFGDALLQIHEAFEFTFATYRAAVLYISEYKFAADDTPANANSSSFNHGSINQVPLPADCPSFSKPDKTVSAAALPDPMSVFQDYVRYFCEERPFSYSMIGGGGLDRYELVAMLEHTK